MTQFVCVVPKAKGPWWSSLDFEEDINVGPLQRTATKAPDIDITVPMILA